MDKNIAYYITDHGYGHATRDIAIIRSLLENFDGLRITICCSKPLDFIRKSIKQHGSRVKFRDVRNDFGYYTDDELKIQKTKTKDEVETWVKNWKDYIDREKQFLQRENIELVTSDIPPQPFICANELDIPSIGISNFTWYELYKGLFGETEPVKQIESAYQKADLGLILPFETGETPFEEEKKIGLVSRRPTKSYREQRKEMGIEENEKLVYLGVGKSYPNKKKSKFSIPGEIRERYSFLVSSGYDLLPDPDYSIPVDVTESQDYINACDLIVSKFGYGIASEGVKSKIPMLLTSRDILEDKKGIEKLRNFKVAKKISKCDFFTGKWLDKIEESKTLKYNYKNISARYEIDGTKEIIKNIREK